MDEHRDNHVKWNKLDSGWEISHSHMKYLDVLLKTWKNKGSLFGKKKEITVIGEGDMKV
jgi:hypothetical protein